MSDALWLDVSFNWFNWFPKLGRRLTKISAQAVEGVLQNLKTIQRSRCLFIASVFTVSSTALLKPVATILYQDDTD